MPVHVINEMCLLIICLTFISGCNKSGTKKPDTRIPPRFAVPSEPKFKKEGSLSFLSKKDRAVKKEIDIEIAGSDDERVLGLMFRKALQENQGMLFIFEEMRPQSFWMKNTYIPLDIVFADDNGKIVKIQRNTKPLSEESIPSFDPALYVVEINAGLASKWGITEGDIISYR